MNDPVPADAVPADDTADDQGPTIVVVTVGDDVYEWDPQKTRWDEAEAIERALGCSYKQWGERLDEGWASALKALVWLLLRRDNPKLRLSEIDGCVGDVKITVSGGAGEKAGRVDPTGTPDGSPTGG